MRGRTAVGVGGGVLALAALIVMPWEGLRLRAYYDPVAIPTTCYGHTGPEVRVGDNYTLEQCQQLLESDLATAYVGVKTCIKAPLKDYEAAALVSFTYNVGVTAMCRSTLARKANAGDMPGACKELDRWVYAKGFKLGGLVKRRAAERKMCEGRVVG